MPPNFARLYFGFWIPQDVMATVTAWRATQDFGPATKWVPPKNLHVTLHFLGEMPRSAIRHLIDTTATIQWTTARAQFIGLDVWNGDLAVLRVKLAPDLHKMHDALADVIRRAGITLEDRPWMPHVTIARQVAVRRISAAPRPDWNVTSFALVESLAGRYTELASFPAASPVSR